MNMYVRIYYKLSLYYSIGLVSIYAEYAWQKRIDYLP